MFSLSGKTPDEKRNIKIICDTILSYWKDSNFYRDAVRSSCFFLLLISDIMSMIFLFVDDLMKTDSLYGIFKN